MTLLELIITGALIFASAYMAASEIALFSLSRFQLRSIKERARSDHRKIKKLLSDPGGLLITILVVNEVLNIAISTLITGSVSRSSSIKQPEILIRLFHLPSWAFETLIGTLIVAPILLLLCEITPKTIAARANQLIAPLTVDTITVIYAVSRPARSLLKGLVAFVARWSGDRSPSHDGNQTLKESDFLLMVEEGHKEGAVQASELELIKNVFEFDDTTVAQVFTPIAQVRSIPVRTTVRQALSLTRGQRFSRVPVTGKNRRDIIGVLYSKDLLRAKLENRHMEDTVSDLMLDPIFVSPSLKLNALFRRFKQQKTHMAVVQKIPGEALGIITMSDVLDVLFDDLFPDIPESEEGDEHEEDETP
jgi:CBS domain containing-hemolysin-like protein